MSGSLGALVGLVTATGLLTMMIGLRRHRRLTLVDRIRRSDVSTSGDTQVLSVFAAVLPEAWLPGKRKAQAAAQASRDSPVLRSRLARAGRPDDLDHYRLERLTWMAVGGAAGLACALMTLIRNSNISVIVIVILVAVGSAIGFVLHDRSLVRDTRRRGERMSHQLPTVAELLAFAVAAGETPLAALGRIERSVGGDLAEEFKNVADDVRSGASFTVALRSMSQRSPSPSVARFVDGVIVATERGTPMADVLRAQAADSRAASRRQLMEGASKKEALMIAPVVFLVLPMLVVIAIYPGVYGLSFTVP